MSELVSDYLLERLEEWGVKRIYGYPGDGINGILGALDRAQDRIDFVQARHEEMAAFMACAHAKFTGEVGVCMATSGPGAIHLLNGLYDAKLDHQPVVAIVGQQSQLSLGGNYQQEVDLPVLFKDVAHEYVHMATKPGQIRHLVDRAMRIAKSERTVTCLIIPNDLQEEEAVPVPPREHGTIHSGLHLSEPRVLPARSDLEHAAEVLNGGERVAMLVGAGALGAAPEVSEAAEMLGAGVAKALLGKAVLPDDLPWVTGSIGLLGTKPSWDLMTDCDTLLMVGSSFPYSEFLPEEGQARGVQIDLDPRMIGIRYPMEVNLVGDAAGTLRELIPLLERKSDRSWREGIESGVDDWWKLMEARAMQIGAAAQPPAPLLGALGALARSGDHLLRLRLVGELVRSRRQDPRGHEGVALGDARDDGPGRSLRDRRQVRVPRPSCDRAGRRRRDADERHQRADHDLQVLGGVERSPPDRAGPQQQRSQPGHLGAAGDGRRPQVRGLPVAAGLPVCELRRAARPARDPRRRSRRRRWQPGIRRWPPTDRSSSRR